MAFAPPKRSGSAARQQSHPASAPSSRHQSPMASSSDWEGAAVRNQIGSTLESGIPEPNDKMYFYKLSQLNFREDRIRKGERAARSSSATSSRATSTDRKYHTKVAAHDHVDPYIAAAADSLPETSIIASYAQHFQHQNKHQGVLSRPQRSTTPMSVRQAPRIPNRAHKYEPIHEGGYTNAPTEFRTLSQPILEVAVPASDAAVKSLRKVGKASPKRSFSGAAIDRQVHIEVTKYLTAVFTEPRGDGEQLGLGGAMCYNDLRDVIDVCGLGKYNTPEGRDDLWFDLQEAQRQLGDSQLFYSKGNSSETSLPFGVGAPMSAYITSVDAFVKVLRARGAIVAARRRIEIALLRAAQQRLQSPTATTKSLRLQSQMQKEFADKLTNEHLHIGNKENHHPRRLTAKTTSKTVTTTVDSSEPIEVTAATKLKGYIVVSPNQGPKHFVLEGGNIDSSNRQASREKQQQQQQQTQLSTSPYTMTNGATSKSARDNTYNFSIKNPSNQSTPASPLDPFAATQPGSALETHKAPKASLAKTSPNSAPLGLPPKSPVHTGRSGFPPTGRAGADDGDMSTTRRRIIKPKGGASKQLPESIESLLLDSPVDYSTDHIATRRTEPFMGNDDEDHTSPTLSQLSSSSHYEESDSSNNAQQWGRRSGADSPTGFSPPQRRNFSPSLRDINDKETRADHRGSVAAPSGEQTVRHLLSRSEAQQSHVGADPRRIHKQNVALPPPMAGSYSASRKRGPKTLKRSDAIDGMAPHADTDAFKRLYEQSRERLLLSQENIAHIGRGSALKRTESYTRNYAKMSRSMRDAEAARAAMEEDLARQCTFKPSINNASHKLGTKGDVRARLYLPTQSRLALIEAPQRAKAAEEQKLQEELLECTFEPTIRSNPTPLPSDHVPPLYVETVSRLRYGIMERKRRPLKFSDTGYLRSEACDATKDMKVLDEKRRLRRERSREREGADYGSMDDLDEEPLTEDDPQYWAQKPVLRLRAQDGTIHDIKMTMS